MLTYVISSFYRPLVLSVPKKKIWFNFLFIPTYFLLQIHLDCRPYQVNMAIWDFRLPKGNGTNRVHWDCVCQLLWQDQFVLDLGRSQGPQVNTTPQKLTRPFGYIIQRSYSHPTDHFWLSQEASSMHPAETRTNCKNHPAIEVRQSH